MHTRLPMEQINRTRYCAAGPTERHCNLTGLGNGGEFTAYSADHWGYFPALKGPRPHHQDWVRKPKYSPFLPCVPKLTTQHIRTLVFRGR